MRSSPFVAPFVLLLRLLVVVVLLLLPGSSTMVQAAGELPDEEFWTIAKTFKASNAENVGSEFGGTVALSPNKNYLAVGDYLGADAVGRVYIYRRGAASGASFTETAILEPTGSGRRIFGVSLQFQNDATLIIGAASEDAVYVFVRTSETWSMDQKITGPANNDFFGAALAVSDEYLVIADDTYGAVIVYEKQGNSWQEAQTLTPPEKGSDLSSFGSAVAVENDIILIGEPYKSSYQGAVYVYTRDSTLGTWNQTQIIPSPDGSEDALFGGTLSMANGKFVVGAENVDKAYLYSVDGSFHRITLQGEGASPNAKFGTSLHLQDDMMAVGARLLGLLDEGAVFLFRRDPNAATETWNQVALMKSGKNGEFVGAAVAVADDIVVAGAPQEGYNDNTFGLVHVFMENQECYVDSDGDGTPNCFDECPENPRKREPTFLRHCK